MELLEFGEMLTELSGYYERKEPKQTTIELWHKKAAHIPSEPIKWIIQKIEDSHESFPKNLPSAIWGAYTEWQQMNPEKMTIEKYFDCSDCNEGLIFAKKEKNGVNYEYVFRCSKCRQNHCRAYPQTNRIELVAEGYDVTPKGGNLKTGKRIKKDLKEIVGAISKDLNNAVDWKHLEITDIPF